MNLKMNLKILCSTLMLLFLSCNSNNMNLSNSSNTIIQSGSICGWGAGTDSLKITRTAISYKMYIPRQSAKPVIQKSRNISENEWSQIINCVNPDTFETLNFNSCNVCVDGCDEWISVENNLNFHKITFGKGQKIDAISKLQLKISALRDEFNQ